MRNIVQGKTVYRNLKLLKLMIKQDSPFCENIYENSIKLNLVSHLIKLIANIVKSKQNEKRTDTQKFNEIEGKRVKKIFDFID